jgi:hypothetical protein
MDILFALTGVAGKLGDSFYDLILRLLSHFCAVG